MPCTKSRANTKVMYATGAGQGNGDNERYQLGQRRHRCQDDPCIHSDASRGDPCEDDARQLTGFTILGNVPESAASRLVNTTRL